MLDVLGCNVPLFLLGFGFGASTTTLTDFSKTWDFDGNDIMPEADPGAEGTWELDGSGDLTPEAL